MAYIVYNEQGIPVTTVDNEIEACVIADFENGWYKAEHIEIEED